MFTHTITFVFRGAQNHVPGGKQCLSLSLLFFLSSLSKDAYTIFHCDETRGK